MIYLNIGVKLKRNRVVGMNQEERAYWRKFYEGRKEILQSSDFCGFVMDRLQDNTGINKVLDCGCGDGRDTRVLAQRYTAHGIESCGFVPESNGTYAFSVGDFTTIDKSPYQLVYSRFTFHSITNEQQEIFLKSIRSGTIVAIETRSDKGEVEHVHHGKNHYRNFTNLQYLKNLLEENQFSIDYIFEGRDIAKYKDENPVCIRVICTKL